jgi:GNAT superfamily N-acetyltransferase
VAPLCLRDDARVSDDDLAELECHGGLRVSLRRARDTDVPALVQLMSDDAISAGRETTDLAPYERAFARIDAEPAQLLVVGEADGEAVCTLQLTVIPGLARGGALRGQVEAVRVRSDLRSRGIGEAMLRWAVEELRARGCAVAQLTTDKRRTDAHRFYARLGWVASHEGFKLQL